MMKEGKGLAFVRKIDTLGRICIPAEYRRQVGLEVDDPIDLVVTGDGLLVRKHEDVSEVAAAMRRLKVAICSDGRINGQTQNRLLERADELESQIIDATGEVLDDDA